MKRRNLFKLAAGLLGAATVPEKVVAEPTARFAYLIDDSIPEELGRWLGWKKTEMMCEKFRQKGCSESMRAVTRHHPEAPLERKEPSP